MLLIGIKTTSALLRIEENLSMLTFQGCPHFISAYGDIIAHYEVDSFIWTGSAHFGSFLLCCMQGVLPCCTRPRDLETSMYKVFSRWDFFSCLARAIIMKFKFVSRVWGVNCGGLSNFESWRQMYIERPHIHFHGCYISKTTYIRHGENSFQDQFYRPWHLVEYFRYLRLVFYLTFHLVLCTVFIISVIVIISFNSQFFSWWFGAYVNNPRWPSY